MKIIIVGLGKVGYAIAQQMVGEEHDLILVDESAAVIEHADATLDAMCVEGNGACASVLLRAGVRDADLVIAATADDEVNLVCSLMAKKLGAKHTVARVRNPEYFRDAPILRREIGLDMIINPEYAAAQEIARILRVPAAFSVESFARGTVELIGFQITEQDGMAGKSLIEYNKLHPNALLLCAAKRGGEVLKYLPRLVEGGIAVNCQLVLCRGINDGDELRRTLSDLLELTPMVQSIAAVPCGVTDYREKLFKQTPYDAKTSAEVIDIMEEFGDECKRRHGKRIIYPSDEWYLKARRPIPPAEFYEDFDQLENGVGMMRLFEDEFRAELDRPHRIYGTKQIDVVTGTMAGPLITELMDELHRQYPMIDVKVHVVKNNFFGGNVGVAGLVTATDIIAQCEGKLESGTLGIPTVMLREEKDTFLDDMTIAQLGERLGVKVEVLPVGGGDEAKALLRTGLHISRRRRA